MARLLPLPVHCPGLITYTKRKETQNEKVYLYVTVADEPGHMHGTDVLQSVEDGADFSDIRSAERHVKDNYDYLHEDGGGVHGSEKVTISVAKYKKK